MTRIFVRMLWVSLIVLGAEGVSGQGYPNKPVRIITTETGGGNDFGARIIAQGLITPLGQQVIVENRSGLLSAEIAAKAPPDGYTMMLSAATIWLLPLIQKTSVDPFRDFSPITLVMQAPQIVVVNPAVAANSVKELVALAKANPGKLNFLSTGIGTTNHLAGELFNSLAGVKMVHVSYKAAGIAITDLLSGEVQIRIGSGAAVMQHVKAGKLRAIAVTSLQPSALYPGLPTVAATLPGYEMVSILCMVAPAKTPTPIINRLNQEIVRVLHTADVKEKFFNTGAETVGNSPSEFAAYMKSDAAKWAKVVKDAGIRAN